MTDTYRDLEDQVRGIFNGIEKVSFTLDGWTGRFCGSFFAVTAHWLDEDWKHNDITIGFESIVGAHTAQIYLTLFVEVIRRFGLQKKILCITSDNGSNLIKMMKDLEAFTTQNSEEW